MSHSVPRILLVEDQENDIRILSRIFAKVRPVELVVARSGLEAWSVFRNSPAFDLVLLDINLPGMDGFELLRKVRELGLEESPVLVMYSSSDDEFEVRKCYQLGANGYVIKPETSKSVKEAIEGILKFWFGKTTANGKGIENESETKRDQE